MIKYRYILIRHDHCVVLPHWRDFRSPPQVSGTSLVSFSNTVDTREVYMHTFWLISVFIGGKKRGRSFGVFLGENP